jgi:hypothetical protein
VEEGQGHMVFGKTVSINYKPVEYLDISTSKNDD